MSNLKLQKLKVNAVDCKDLENLVKQVYDKEYDFVSSEEAVNDSQHLFSDISGVVDEWDVPQLEEFKRTGKSSFLTYILLQDLCKQGHIEPGNYLIEVCW